MRDVRQLMKRLAGSKVIVNSSARYWHPGAFWLTLAQFSQCRGIGSTDSLSGNALYIGLVNMARLKQALSSTMQ